MATADGPSTVLIDQAKLTLNQLVKTSKVSRSRGSALAEKPEVQNMLDKDLFLIQSDRRTKMTKIQEFQLVRVLAQFFLERVDDGHRYAYFEAIFFGRHDDPLLHDYRISVLFKLVSFSVQYPVLQIFNHVMGWLCQMKNEELAIMYSDRLIEMMVEHFIRLSTEQNPLHEFLNPLDNTCSEFCALFVARAPLHGEVTPEMASLIVRYCSRNMQFILRHLRDTPWLGNDFAEKVIPKLIERVLADEVGEADEALGTCLGFFLIRWNIDVLANEERGGTSKRIEVVELLLSNAYPWTKIRATMLASAIGASGKSEFNLRREMSLAEVPVEYQQVVELLASDGGRDNPQRLVDAVYEMDFRRTADKS